MIAEELPFVDGYNVRYGGTVVATLMELGGDTVRVRPRPSCRIGDYFAVLNKLCDCGFDAK